MPNLCLTHTEKTAQLTVDDNSKDEGELGKLLSKASDIKQLLYPQSPKGRNVYLLLREFLSVTTHSGKIRGILYSPGDEFRLNNV